MKNVWMRKGYFLSILLVLSIFVGCSSKNLFNGTNDQDSQETKQSLTFRITWKTYSGRGEAIQRIVNDYNAQNKDGFEVILVDGDEDLNAIEDSLDDHAVDLYVLPYRFVQYLGDVNKLEEITQDFQEERTYFYEALWSLSMINEKGYGVPWLGHSMCLLYNKSLLEKAGVDPVDITSLKALETACEQVEAHTAAKGFGLVGANHNDVSWMVNQFIYGFGARLVNENGTHVALNTDEAKSALEFYKNVLGQHAQATWLEDTGVEVMDYFRNQQVAFEIQGLWGVTDIWKNGRAFEVGVISLKSMGLYSEVGPMMVSMDPQLSAEKRAAAITFIRFLISIEAQEKIMAGEHSPEFDSYFPFRTPVRKDLADGLILVEYPDFLPFLDGFSQPSIDVPVPKWQLIKDQYYAPGLHQYMSNEVSLESFIETIEREGNRLLMGEEE